LIFGLITLIGLFYFCRAMLCKRGLCHHAVSVCLSVCPSVCHVYGFCQNDLYDTIRYVYFRQHGPYKTDKSTKTHLSHLQIFL